MMYQWLCSAHKLAAKGKWVLPGIKDVLDLAGFDQFANVTFYRCKADPSPLDQGLKCGMCGQANLMAGLLQTYTQGQVRLNISARADGDDRYAHEYAPNLERSSCQD